MPFKTYIDECSEVYSIAMTDIELFLNTSGTPCLECSFGVPVGPDDISYVIEEVLFSGRGSSFGNFVINNNGQLAIFNAEQQIPAGSEAVEIVCGVGAGASTDSYQIALLSNSECY